MNKVLGFGLFLSLLLITACGPESSTYTPTQDSISTSADITVDASAIHITNKGASVQSEKIDECVIGFDQETLPYAFNSNEELVLNSQAVEYLRPLASTAGASAGDSRLFAVWKVPAHMVQQVSYNIEIEIQPAKIIYRNTCVR